MTDGTMAAFSPVNELSEDQMRSLMQQIGDSVVNSSKLSKEVADLRQTVDNLVREVNEVRDQLSDAEAQGVRLKQEAEQAVYRLDEATHKYESLVERHSALSAKYTELSFQYEGAVTERNTAEKERDAIRIETEQLRNLYHIRGEAIDRLHNTIQSLQDENTSLSDQLADKQDQLSDLEKAKEEIIRQAQMWKEKCDRAEARLVSIRIVLDGGVAVQEEAA